MKQVLFSFCVVLLLALLGCSPASVDQEKSAQVRSDIYRSIDGRSFIPCYTRDGQAECGERLFRRPVSDSFETGIPAEESDWYDCGDQDFACVANPGYLMAVPKNGELKVGQVFKVRGSELVVRQCFPFFLDMDATCDTALISSRCADSCGCFDGFFEFEVVFYYSKSVGISAFFLVPQSKDLAAARVDRSWALIAESGFLKADFHLAPMNNRDPCQVRE